MTDRTPEEAIARFGEALAQSTRKRIRTIVPATIVSYAAQVATVQVAPFEDGEIIPPIPSCPVRFPSGGGWSITWTLLPGDHVELHVPDRSIDELRATGAAYDPADKRMHPLDGCFVWPADAGTPAPIASTSSPNLVITGPAGEALSITPAGTVSIAGGVAPAGQVAMAQAVHDWLTSVINASVVGAMDGGATFRGNILAQLIAQPFTAFASTNVTVS